MVVRTSRLAATALIAMAILTGCDTLPRSGPDDSLIESQATVSTRGGPTQAALQYALVDLAEPQLPYLVDPGAGSFYSSFGGGRGPAVELKVGTGDVVQVTLFESAAGGLFIPSEAGSRPGNYVTLPSQTVDRVGNISIPYAGLIQAKGRSVIEIKAEIESKLKDRAIEPQAVVTLASQSSNQVTVVGEVAAPGKISINPAGDRIIDVISKANGIRYPGYETYVTLERGKRRATVWFDAIIRNPQENIYVIPGDTVYVYREQRSFMAFGATGASGHYKFEQDRLTFAEAVGKVGGLMDERADPRQVFLYRLEPRATLVKMGVDMSKFGPQMTVIPTIYRTNFRDPSSFFVAQRFPMRNGDILYVSNADQVELFKFLNLITGVSGSAGSIAEDVLSVNAVKNMR